MGDIIDLIVEELVASGAAHRSTQNMADSIRSTLTAHGFVLLDTKQSDNQCFLKALAEREPTFTLRAQDLSAPSIVRFWAAENSQLSPVRLKEALRKAELMESWPNRRLAD
jgi:hypothetical protein